MDFLRHLGGRLGPRGPHLALPGARCLADAEEGAQTCLGAPTAVAQREGETMGEIDVCECDWFLDVS